MRPLRQRSGNSQSSAESLRLAEALSQFCALSEFFERETLSQIVKRTAFSEFRAEKSPVNSKLLRRTDLIIAASLKPSHLQR